jgi:hypothetical protein
MVNKILTSFVSLYLGIGYLGNSMNAYPIKQDIKQKISFKKTNMQNLNDYLNECIKDSSKNYIYVGYPNPRIVAIDIMTNLKKFTGKYENNLDSITAEITASEIMNTLKEYKEVWNQQYIPQTNKNNSSNPILRKQILLSNLLQNKLRSLLNIMYVSLGIKE